MKCREVIECLEKLAPKNMALSWDNPGLLAGRMDKEVLSVYLAVDATDEVIEDAINKKVDMLITHHPLIFGSIKSVSSETFIGNRLINLISNDISYYAMHTNFDVCGMADYSAKILGIKDVSVFDVTGETDDIEEGIGRVGSFTEEMSLLDLAHLVKDRFQIDNVKVFGNLAGKVRRVAISPGSGKSMIDLAVKKRVDCLITGDIDHHAGIDAVAQNVPIIDAGHYGIEKIFIPFMDEYIKKNTELKVFCEVFKNPFTIV